MDFRFTEEERSAWRARTSDLEARIRREQAALPRPTWIWNDPNDPYEEPEMKMVYTTPNGRVSFEFEIGDGKKAFEAMAKIAELFEEPDCGLCGSKNIRPEVRDVRDFTYYNLRCIDCQAQLDFGQKKDGKTLFAKRWDSDEKRAMPNRGWYVWQPTESSGNKKEPSAASPEHAGEGEDIPF